MYFSSIILNIFTLVLVPSPSITPYGHYMLKSCGLMPRFNIFTTFSLVMFLSSYVLVYIFSSEICNVLVETKSTVLWIFISPSLELTSSIKIRGLINHLIINVIFQFHAKIMGAEYIKIVQIILMSCG